jgi:23S rRNA U2552 (ribose-2'-O)-methylase RlmE/FtsJ
MITANADWSRVVATRLMPDGTLTGRDIGPWQPPR